MNDEKKALPLDEYLSFVRHELRTQLWLIREGVSQVVDGLGNGKCEKCFEMLETVIKAVDEMTEQTTRFLGDDTFKEAVSDISVSGEKKETPG